MGGGSPDQFREGLAKLEEAWQAAGREGKPRTMALSYYALGDGAKAAADGYLNDYYGFLGEHVPDGRRQRRQGRRDRQGLRRRASPTPAATS